MPDQQIRIVELLERICNDVRLFSSEVVLLTKGVLSRKEAAQYLGIHVNSLDHLVRSGRIRRVSLHVSGQRGRVGFRREELDHFIIENEDIYKGLVADEHGKTIIDGILREN